MNFRPVLIADRRALWTVSGRSLVERAVDAVIGALGVSPVVETETAEVGAYAGQAGFVTAEPGRIGGPMLRVDPLVQPLSAMDVRSVADVFVHRAPCKVMSLTELPSQYHPKKLLVLHADGRLVPLEEGGVGLYRRQQLHGDVMFEESGAIVAHPGGRADPLTIPVVLPGRRHRVTGIDDLALVAHLLGELEGGDQ